MFLLLHPFFLPLPTRQTPRLHRRHGINPLRMFPPLLRNPPTPLHHIPLIKQPIDLFQREIRRLWVAKVHERDEGEIEAHEDEVALPGEGV